MLLWDGISHGGMHEQIDLLESRMFYLNTLTQMRVFLCFLSIVNSYYVNTLDQSATKKNFPSGQTELRTRVESSIQRTESTLSEVTLAQLQNMKC